MPTDVRVLAFFPAPCTHGYRQTWVHTFPAARSIAHTQRPALISPCSFITFEDESSVEKVFSAGSMHELAGKKVEVKNATPKGSGPQGRSLGAYPDSVSSGGRGVGGGMGGGAGGRGAGYPGGRMYGGEMQGAYGMPGGYMPGAVAAGWWRRRREWAAGPRSEGECGEMHTTVRGAAESGAASVPLCMHGGLR